ncbi:MAG: CvpA family protein [Dysgonamonadaceae bacterium]
MTWIDFTTLILIGFSAFKGYFEGLILQVTSLLGLTIGAIFAGKIAAFLEPGLSSFFKTSPHIIGPISYSVAFLLIIIGFLMLGKMTNGLINALHAGCLNSLAGAAFSMFKWLFLFSVFLNVIETMDSHEWVIKKETKQKSFSHDFVKRLMPAVVPYFTSHHDEKDSTNTVKTVKTENE